MDGGAIKKYSITIINIIGFSIIFVLNLFNQISEGKSLIGRILYTLPFLILIVLCIIFRKKYKYNAYLYLFMSLLALFTTSETANLTGLVFLIFSIYIFQSFKTNIIAMIATSITIASKVFFGFTSMQVMALFVAYITCLLIYYILIHPKKPQINYGLDERTAEIIEFKLTGYSSKEIADKIYLSTDAVNKRIQRACMKYEARNSEQLVYKLMKMGYLGPR